MNGALKKLYDSLDGVIERKTVLELFQRYSVLKRTVLVKPLLGSWVLFDGGGIR